MQFPLNSCAISNGPVSITAQHQEISWRKYMSSKMILRVTALSNQALVEIIMDMEVLLSKPVPTLHPTSPHPRPTIVQRAKKAIIKHPHGASEEEIYQLAFPSEQIAQAAMGSMRAYFDINPPVNGAGVKRPRPQSQSQQPQRQQPMPQMQNFANPGYPHHHPIPPPSGQPQMYPTYPSTSTNYIPPVAEPVPQALSPGYVPAPVQPAIPTTRTSPIQPKPTVYPTPPVTVPSPVREPSPPIEESQRTETQNEVEVEVETQPFLETQYSPPKSSSSSFEKPTNAQIQRSSIPESSDETQDELNPSSGAVRDLLSLDDEYDTGLGDHPALDPYEGMPWSRGLAQGQAHGQPECPVSRPNRYIDAGVYSMTEDQLDGIIGEIVLETGFQGMCERIYRVMDARYINEEREEMYDEDAF